jgi:hypothetical protein
MSSYQYYDPYGEQQRAEQERAQMMARMEQMMRIRQKYTDDLELQRQAEEQKRIQAENQEKKNWMTDTAQGASMGMSVGGPWGALAGGIIGTAKGQYEAYQQRRKEGQSGMKAFGNTAFDTPFGAVGDVASLGGANLLRKATTGSWTKTDEGMALTPESAQQFAMMGGRAVGSRMQNNTNMDRAKYAQQRGIADWRAKQSAQPMDQYYRKEAPYSSVPAKDLTEYNYGKTHDERYY